MRFKRHSIVGHGAFTGPYYVIDSRSKIAVQSEATLHRAIRAAEQLNAHEIRNGRDPVFTAAEGEWP